MNGERRKDRRDIEDRKRDDETGTETTRQEDNKRDEETGRETRKQEKCCSEEVSAVHSMGRVYELITAGGGTVWADCFNRNGRGLVSEVSQGNWICETHCVCPMIPFHEASTRRTADLRDKRNRMKT